MGTEIGTLERFPCKLYLHKVEVLPIFPTVLCFIPTCQQCSALLDVLPTLANRALLYLMFYPHLPTVLCCTWCFTYTCQQSSAVLDVLPTLANRALLYLMFYPHWPTVLCCTWCFTHTCQQCSAILDVLPTLANSALLYLMLGGAFTAGKIVCVQFYVSQ